MNKIIPLVLFIAFLSGCVSHTKDGIVHEPGKSTSKLIKIYKSDGSKQCDPSSGVATEIMKTQLISKGVGVFCSHKGNTGMMYPSMCGAETGAINIYQIHQKKLQDAEKLGFKSTHELTGYSDQVCPIIH